MRSHRELMTWIPCAFRVIADQSQRERLWHRRIRPWSSSPLIGVPPVGKPPATASIHVNCPARDSHREGQLLQDLPPSNLLHIRLLHADQNPSSQRETIQPNKDQIAVGLQIEDSHRSS